MKKLLLTISAVVLSATTYAQVIAAGISPQSIVANYTHTWADPGSGWGTPDFNIPGTFVQDTLKIVDTTSASNAEFSPRPKAASRSTRCNHSAPAAWNSRATSNGAP